jgi:hypothetical protein
MVQDTSVSGAAGVSAAAAGVFLDAGSTAGERAAAALSVADYNNAFNQGNQAAQQKVG